MPYMFHWTFVEHSMSSAGTTSVDTFEFPSCPDARIYVRYQVDLQKAPPKVILYRPLADQSSRTRATTRRAPTNWNISREHTRRRATLRLPLQNVSPQQGVERLRLRRLIRMSAPFGTTSVSCDPIGRLEEQNRVLRGVMLYSSTVSAKGLLYNVRANQRIPVFRRQGSPE